MSLDQFNIFFIRLGRECGSALGDRRTLLRILLGFVNFVVIILVVVIIVVVVVARFWTVQTQRLALAVVQTRGANALTAGVSVEPAIARRSHRLTGLTTASQRQTGRHVGNCTVGGVGRPIYSDEMMTMTTNLVSVRVHALCRTTSKQQQQQQQQQSSSSSLL